MILMIDTNILIDHIGRREPFYELSRKVCLLGLAGFAQTYISANMISDIFYILRKDYGSAEAQRMIAEDLGFLKIVGLTGHDIESALAMRWTDFESCLVSICAQKAKSDYIVTRNVEDFSRSSIKALTPAELFAELEARGIVFDEMDLVS